MYLSFIRLVLEYADIVCDGCSDTSSNRLQRIQNESVGISKLTRSTSLDKLNTGIRLNDGGINTE